MLWNEDTHFSNMIESSSAAPVIPTSGVEIGAPTVARALFKCVSANASFPVWL